MLVILKRPRHLILRLDTILLMCFCRSCTHTHVGEQDLTFLEPNAPSSWDSFTNLSLAYTHLYRALTSCTRVDTKACALEGSLCEPEVRHSNSDGWFPVIILEHRAIGSLINTNLQEGGTLYCLVSSVNLILWWMLFRWYKECFSFSGSRDHTAKPAGCLLISWSSTFFSNLPQRYPLSAEKL